MLGESAVSALPTWHTQLPSWHGYVWHATRTSLVMSSAVTLGGGNATCAASPPAHLGKSCYRMLLGGADVRRNCPAGMRSSASSSSWNPDMVWCWVVQLMQGVTAHLAYAAQAPARWGQAAAAQPQRACRCARQRARGTTARRPAPRRLPAPRSGGRRPAPRRSPGCAADQLLHGQPPGPWDIPLKIGDVLHKSLSRLEQGTDHVARPGRRKDEERQLGTHGEEVRT